MNRRLIIAAGIVLLIILAYVAGQSLATPPAPKATGIGHVDSVIGLTKNAFIIQNGTSLLSIERSNTKKSTVLAHDITMAMLSEDGTRVLWQTGYNSTPVVVVKNLATGEEKQYPSYVNAYWYQNQPYFVKPQGDTYTVFDNANNAVLPNLASDVVRPVGNTFVTLEKAASPEEIGQTYRLIPADQSGEGTTLDLFGADGEPWFTPSKVFFTDSDGELNVADSNGNISKLNIAVTPTDITHSAGDEQYFLTQITSPTKSVVINKLNITTKSKSQIKTVPLDSLSQNKTEPSFVSKQLIIDGHTLYAVTDEDIWEITL